MKTLLFLLSFVLLSFTGFSQLRSSIQNNCAIFAVDLLDGKINGAEPDFTQGEIKRLLPCFSAEEPENNTSKCGGLVSYKNQDVYFYTGRNYVEIREKFKGKLSVPLMGAPRNGLFKWFGNVKLKDVSWDAYQTSYGLLIVYFNKANKVNKIQFTTEGTETLNLCQ